MSIDMNINMLGLDELMKAKQAAGRPQDQLDLARLSAKKSGYAHDK